MLKPAFSCTAYKKIIRSFEICCFYFLLSYKDLFQCYTLFRSYGKGSALWNFTLCKQLRKQKGVSQETLAEFLGISTQAISKWKCELSYPDIELLPILADYFKVSIDFLLTGLRFSQLEDSNRFIDKNTLHIVQYKGNKILTKREYNSVIKIRIRAEDAINGSVEA